MSTPDETPYLTPGPSDDSTHLEPRRDSDEAVGAAIAPSVDDRLDELSKELGRLQRLARTRGLPVLLLVDGWEASGKGTLVGNLVQALDPRGYRVVTPPSSAVIQTHQSLLRQAFSELPASGEILIVDQSYYSDLWRRKAQKNSTLRNLDEELKAFFDFERTLFANGYLVIKCFLDIDKRRQARRFNELLSNPHTAWRIDERDLHEHRHFKRYQKIIAHIIESATESGRPIQIINARKRKLAMLDLLELLVKEMSTALAPMVESPQAIAIPSPTQRYFTGDGGLGNCDLSRALDRPSYEERLPQLQEHLRELEHRIYRERIPVVMVFEGWDAAGKGGAIRRLVGGLDPRGYEVVPIAAPSTLEKQHHYLWRFARKFPRPGHMTLFDRSWYGRVLVERVEGFCSPEAWQRAYSEIVAFEEDFAVHGGVLVKFWFQIDPATQLARFEARQSSEDKRWKITEEDWRNRAKWDAYETALVDALSQTSTVLAPWTIVPACDKLLARILTLETAIGAIERRLTEASSKD